MATELTFTALVADDELAGRNYIIALLERDGRFQIESVCDSGKSAIEQALKTAPDVLFLDIKMPQGNGFLVAKSLEELDSLVVFVTGFSQHALKAFEHEAFDFVEKPIGPARFQRTLDRLHKRLSERFHAAHRESDEAKLVLPSTKGVIICYESEINRVEGAGNYVRLCTGNEIHLIRSTLGAFSELIKSDFLLRVHRSYIVNLNKVKLIKRKKDLAELVLSDGCAIPVGPTWQNKTFQILQSKYKLSSSDT